MSKIRVALEDLIQRKRQGVGNVLPGIVSKDLPSRGCWILDGKYMGKEYSGCWIINGKKAITQAEKMSDLERVYTGILFNIYKVKNEQD